MAVTQIANEPFTDEHTPERIRKLLDEVVTEHDTWYHNNVLIDDLEFVVSSGFLGRVSVRFYRISKQDTPLATVECPFNVSSTSIIDIFSKANLRVAL